MKLKTNRSIFFHLMKLSIIIILVSAFLISMINIFLINQYTKKEKATNLKTVSDQVNKLTEQFTSQYNQNVNFIYQLSIDQLADYVDGTIFITNTDGDISIVSSTDAAMPDKIDIAQYKDVLNGHSTYKTGAFNSIFKYNTFSVASPFTYNNAVSGIIFVVTKSEFFSTESVAVASMTLFSVAVAIVFALIISYFLSTRLIKPLKTIENAAREITLGRYVKLDSSSKINEYNELITSFNKMSEDLEKQDKARSDFIANVSHDLRTPITTIMGFVRGIMDGTIPPEMENQYLGITLSEAERMKNMVNNNLDLSKYESGNIKLNYSSFNLNDIIRSIVISMEKRIREKGITIQMQYEKAENIVEADESAIYRVIQNLLDNALKFASVKTDITISIKQINNTVFCKIKNIGSTISEDEQKFIWDRYYKADQSRSADKRGSGLGLFIVKNIINQHNQQIRIESDENSVAFEFTLNVGEC